MESGDADSGDEHHRPAVDPVDWETRLGPPSRRALAVLERATNTADRGVDRLVGNGRLNPLHYTGTITAFLVIIIIVTGAYLTMFYQFGFDASYDAVAAIESRWVGRIMRAAHRYASIGAVVMTVIHGWRTFVMDRFRGARWVPWVSGIGMTVLLWIGGVTGYWMIWDTRAGPLNESLVNGVGGWRRGLDFLLDIVVTDAAGSGWVFLLVLFMVHLLVTAVIALLYWYHVKRLTRRRILPPGPWMTMIGGVLLLTSILLPVGMLPMYDRTLLSTEMPFDPYFFFLLEPARRWPTIVFWGAALFVLAVAAGLPWLLRRRPPLPPIAIDAHRCTGCTLCAKDCPYRAIEMVPDESSEHRQLAVVDPELCVSCGICIGSCPELAMTMGNAPAELLAVTVSQRLSQAPDDRTVEAVFTCERWLLSLEHDLSIPTETDDTWSVVTALPCLGMVHPDLVGTATEAGADKVRFLGCPPDDCANLEGNTWLAERLDRSRLPRLKKQFVDAPITVDYRTPESTLARSRTSDDAPLTNNSWIRPGAMLAVGLVALVASTWWNFRPVSPEAAIDISVDHQRGATLMGVGVEPAIDADSARLTVSVDGEQVLASDYPFGSADQADTMLAWERVAVDAGTHRLRIELGTQSQPPVVLFDDVIGLEAGQILTLNYRDEPPNRLATEGRRIFTASSIGASAGCQVCHSLEEDVVLVGPSLYGIAESAAVRVPGLSAEEYLRQSLLDPDAYVVDGFPAGQMLPDFATRLTEEEISNLVAFMMTLEGSP